MQEKAEKESKARAEERARSQIIEKRMTEISMEQKAMVKALVTMGKNIEEESRRVPKEK